ncbi:MAG: hypothetical protein KIS66_07670 [Fimbriimonadaceae bacterium]|nr:hypothetical protein [Fimbriimonadaceae bacterium]
MLPRDAGSVWVTLAALGLTVVTVALMVGGFGVWVVLLGLAATAWLHWRSRDRDAILKDERRATE